MDEFRLMNKFQVYLTNGGIIYIEADDFSTYYEYGVVCFIKGDQHIAIFVLSNIYGLRKWMNSKMRRMTNEDSFWEGTEAGSRECRLYI